MKKVLVSGGCSFAYGFNLQDRNDRYAKVIADQCGLELFDTSTSGAGNDTIAAATVTGVHTSLKKYRPQEIVVIVGWTDQARFEYWDNVVKGIQTAFPEYQKHKFGAVNPRHAKISQFAADHMWSLEYSYYKLIHSFNYLNSFCRANGVTIINKPNLTLFKVPVDDVNMINSEMNGKSYVNDVVMPDDKKAWENIFEATSLHKHTSTLGLQIEPGYDSHPNAEGHRSWARKLMRDYGNILGT